MQNLLKDIIVHTPCKVSYITNNYLLYFLEFFPRNKSIMQDFLKSLKFERKMDNTFITSGSNNLLYVFKKNDSSDLISENTLWCNLNKKFIDKLLIETPIDERYNDFFLSTMFDENTSEKIIARENGLYWENEYMIMMPNIILFYINNRILTEIKNFKIKKSKNLFIPKIIENNVRDDFKDIVFSVFIKPPNYSELKDLYDSNQIHNLKEKLSSNKFVSSFHLDSTDVALLENIRNSILKFYEIIDRRSSNIKIEVQIHYQIIFG